MLWCALGAAAELSPDAWRQDLDFLANELPKRHKNLFQHLSREEFSAAVKQMRERLPGMSDAEVRVAFVRLVASVANGHTWINALAKSDGLPVIHRQFGDAFYAIATKPDYTNVIGARLTGIGAAAIPDVVERLRPLVLAETTQMVTVQLPGWFSNADALRGTGLMTGDRVTFHYERDGRAISLELPVIPAGQMKDWIYSSGQGEPPTPLYRSSLKTAYWHRCLAEARALYIQYNQCQDLASPSFAEFTEQIIGVAASNRVGKVIVDLRFNGGGNNQVIKPLLKALGKEPLKHARLFVITSAATFSSGAFAACELKTKLGATVVGETSSQHLHSYGDTRTFVLPNSGFIVGYATKYFHFVPGPEELLVPELPVLLKAEDYFAGRDPALERILAPNP